MEDFSEYVTHFTKTTTKKSDYKNQLSILGGRILKAQNGFGVARKKAPNLESQKSVCLSEIPLHCLDEISERKSRYGIGFKKNLAISKGALPIWYVEKESTQHLSIEQMIENALDSPVPNEEPIWNLTPFIDIPGKYGNAEYRFEWEREWRCVGDFKFKVEEVAFLIIPEELHIKACEFFRVAKEDNTGPSYECPFIDSSWGLDKINGALDHGWPGNMH